MTTSHRAAFRLVLVLAVSAHGSAVLSVDDPTAAQEVVDTTMAHRIHGAWDRVRELQRADKAAEADRLQRELAAGFFEDYLKRPETTPGQQALTTAFRMWGSVGAIAEIELALPQIDKGSSLWGHLALSARPAFVAADRLDEFREVVTALAAEVTAPEAASEVWVLLGRDYRATGDLDAAGRCFRRVVELDADPFFVRVAESALQDMGALAIGQPAPDFEATSVDGRAVRLSALLGKVVLLEFWSTTCPPCVPEIEHLKRIRADFPPEQVELIGIAMDPDLEAVTRMVGAKGMDWPQLCDEKGSGGPVPLLYNVTGIPRSFLIDRDGRIAVRDARGEELEQAVRELSGANREPAASGE
jgi:peroxiredoxin